MYAHHAEIIELIRAAESRAYNAGYQDGVKDRPARKGTQHVAGGHALAAALSPAQRSEMARAAANARWNPELEKNA